LLCPWDDRELYELILSLPSTMLVGAPDRRALFDRAFGDLLPREVLRPARRGRQNVDFHAAIDPVDLAQGVKRYRQSVLCREHVDLERLEQAVPGWPTRRITNIRHYSFWVNQFLPAFSLASFLYTRDQAGAPASDTRAQHLHGSHESHPG
jgi:hypothetical protein